jgi:hypothetical protein
MAQVASPPAQAAPVPIQTPSPVEEAGRTATIVPAAASAPQQASVNDSPVQTAADQKRKKKWPRWLHVDHYLYIYDKSAQYLDRYWLVECCCLIRASLAFAAIVITLAVHQNKPLPQWPSLISINSLVAIFIAVMKTALMVPVVESKSISKFVNPL